MKSKNLALGVVGLIVLLGIFGGLKYLYDYFVNDGHIAGSIGSGIWNLRSNPALFLLAVLFLIIVVALIYSGLKGSRRR